MPKDIDNKNKELLTTHELMTAAPPFLHTLLHLLFWHAHLTVFVISTFYHLALRHPKRWEILQTFLTSLSVTLACTATSMTVTLNTDEVFKGKLFAFVNPRACLAKGKGRRQTSLTFQASLKRLTRDDSDSIEDLTWLP